MEARHQAEGQKFAEARLKALERLKSRDWADAVRLLQELRKTTPEKRKAEIESLIEYSGTLEAAALHELRSEWAQALAIYRRLTTNPSAQQDYLRERIEAVEAKVGKSR